MNVKLTLYVGINALVVLLPISADAQSLNGRYVSNMNNTLVISGNRYTYTQKPPNVWRTSGTLQNQGDSVQFQGYLHYSCARQGTTLNCGQRTWVKQ